MKKIITILLSLLMVVSLGTVAFAENEATLTITGAPDGGVIFVVGENTINNSNTVRVNSGGSVVVKFKKVNTIQENENTVTKTFLKWVDSSNGKNIEILSETDEEPYHIFTIRLNGNVTLSAKYLTNDEVSTKYYVQNVYVGGNDTLQTQTPVILKTEELPTDVAQFGAINQYDFWHEGEVQMRLADLLGQENLNNYDYLKQIVYDYSDPSNPVKMDLMDANHHPMEDTHYFNKSDKNILVVFYYKQKLPTGYSELAKEGTNDFAIKSLQNEDIFAIKTGTKFKLIAPASLDDGNVFKYWIGLNANETTELVQFDNIKNNETEAQVNKDGRYVISAIYGPADAKVTKITRTNVYGDTTVNEGISYRLGSVDNIGSILPDFESYNDVSYVISELSIETPNGIVLKKYKTSDLEIDGSNTGVTNMFKDNTPIPNGYDELVYKKTFVKAIGIDQQSALAKVQSLKNISADFDGNNISSINPDIDYLEASTEDINKVSNTIDNNSSVTKYFDINMVAVDANNNKAYVTDFSDDIEVSVTLSDAELAKIGNKDDVKLVRVHNGQAEIIPATLNGNELKFKSNQFSTYALVNSSLRVSFAEDNGLVISFAENEELYKGLTGSIALSGYGEQISPYYNEIVLTLVDSEYAAKGYIFNCVFDLGSEKLTDNYIEPNIKNKSVKVSIGSLKKLGVVNGTYNITITKYGDTSKVLNVGQVSLSGLEDVNTSYDRVDTLYIDLAKDMKTPVAGELVPNPIEADIYTFTGGKKVKVDRVYLEWARKVEMGQEYEWYSSATRDPYKTATGDIEYRDTPRFESSTEYYLSIAYYANKKNYTNDFKLFVNDVEQTNINHYFVGHGAGIGMSRFYVEDTNNQYCTVIPYGYAQAKNTVPENITTEEQTALSSKMNSMFTTSSSSVTSSKQLSYTSDANKASGSSSIQTAVGAGGTIEVSLRESTAKKLTEESGSTKVVVTSMSFDVTPTTSTGEAKHGNVGTTVTFRLPVDKDADFTYANVTHEGTFLQQCEVKSDANGKYIEVSSNTFSVFGYELTNTKYVAPSTGGPGPSSSVSTITRKPVVNTSAK